MANFTEFQLANPHLQFIWFWNYAFFYFRLSLKQLIYSIKIISKASICKVSLI